MEISKQVVQFFHKHHNERGILEDCHNVENMDIQCIHCKVLYWMDEQTMLSTILNLQFGIRYFHGKIEVVLLQNSQLLIRQLLDGQDEKNKEFQKTI